MLKLGQGGDSRDRLTAAPGLTQWGWQDTGSLELFHTCNTGDGAITYGGASSEGEEGHEAEEV